MAVNGGALAAVAAGIVAAYAGIKGYSIPQTIQDLVTGKSPARQSQAAAVTSPASTASTTTAPPPGGSYSHAQLMGLWRLAGGSAATANNAACHAIQESSGNPDATSGNPDGGTNVGLWQLDTPGGVGAGYTIAQLKDPMTNARVAVSGSGNGTNWSDWATPGC